MPEPMYCRYLNGGETSKGSVKWAKLKEIHDFSLRLAVGPLVPLTEALGTLSLSLPWEIATADVFLGDNEGAWMSGRGGGWEIKNARCREMRTWAVGSMVGSWKREFGEGTVETWIIESCAQWIFFLFCLGRGKGAVFLQCFSPPFQRRKFWTS